MVCPPKLTPPGSRCSRAMRPCLIPSMVCIAGYTCKTCSFYLVASRYANLCLKERRRFRMFQPFKRLVTTRERGSGKRVGVAQRRAGGPIGDLVVSAELFVNTVKAVSLVIIFIYPFVSLLSRFSHVDLGRFTTQCRFASCRRVRCVMLPAASPVGPRLS